MNIIKTLSAIMLRGLPENYFRQCQQAWQGAGTLCHKESISKMTILTISSLFPLVQKKKKTGKNMQLPFLPYIFPFYLHLI
jgi:hypothetical protein